jgi:hypothetical protein
MNTHADALTQRTAPATMTPTVESQSGPLGTIPVCPGYDVAINAESRTYRDDDELVSILSVHTLACPLIRAELRGESSVRLLAYYHTHTRLGLEAHEAVLRDDGPVQERLGLRHFVRCTLNLPDTSAHLHDPAIREMYLHEVIRRLAHPIAACRLESSDEFAVTRII